MELFFIRSFISPPDWNALATPTGEAMERINIRFSLYGSARREYAPGAQQRLPIGCEPQEATLGNTISLLILLLAQFP